MKINNKPLISIITVVYNGESYLEDTIESVINQTYNNVEYIIIDGGSTDRTVDIIKKYENRIDYWTSERDGGIYDAMNKGILKATGDIIGMINADDWYEPDIFVNIASVFTENKNIDIVFGDLNIYSGTKKKQKTKYGNINKLYKNMSINHPTCFVQKKVYKDRLFDTSFKIAGDYDFIMYCKSMKLSFFYLNSLVANMRLGGLSTSGTMVNINEIYIVHEKYYGKIHALKYNLLYKSRRLIKNIIKYKDNKCIS